ncbi:sugar ABC transporter permease, partial [Mesorhizobium sp. M4A.F.Ca.ET.029.04.2.1]
MQRSWRRRFPLPAVIGTIPMILVAVGVFVIGIGFSVLWSFTSSKLFPTYDFVGLAQYRR